MRGRCLAWLLAGLAWLPAAAAVAQAPVRTLSFDPAHSSVGFQLRTRWGKRLDGAFPDYDGEVRVFDDGRRQVRVELDSRAMEIVGHGRYTRWARGPDFFDVDRHPSISFVSEHYDDARLRDGGPLHGTLTMRGISRPVRFTLEPAACASPGIACDVVASGTVDRTDFGMDAWQLAVGDAVRFHLRVRTHAGTPE